VEIFIIHRQTEQKNNLKIVFFLKNNCKFKANFIYRSYIFRLQARFDVPAIVKLQIYNILL